MNFAKEGIGKRKHRVYRGKRAIQVKGRNVNEWVNAIPNELKESEQIVILFQWGREHRSRVIDKGRLISAEGGKIARKVEQHVTNELKGKVEFIGIKDDYDFAPEIIAFVDDQTYANCYDDLLTYAVELERSQLLENDTLIKVLFFSDANGVDTMRLSSLGIESLK